ncbi:MAG TPA: helix-turn-helix transcriptional regulator [Novimethylophilus sp.]|uniref:helix-turn-helix domain-containing protein n=1 Tax=Novimethylophilus sp. TaxID=2137426 RepID=UPI002F420FC1
MARKARTQSALGGRLGRRVAERRKELGWLQAELAEKLGVETETISRFERGLALPSLERLDEMAHILGISIAELLSSATGNPIDQAVQIAHWLTPLSESERLFVTEHIQNLCRQIAGKRTG